MSPEILAVMEDQADTIKPDLDHPYKTPEYWTKGGAELARKAVYLVFALSSLKIRSIRA
jgi:hypothetical protein